MEDNNEDRLFKIGAVARLTGISVHTIRKWEARYGAVAPGRSEGGKRLYSETDVRRLQLIGKLSGRGLSLQSISRNSLEQLTGLWNSLGEGRTQGGRPRVAVLGSGLSASLQLQEETATALDVVAAADNETDLLRQLEGGDADVLLVDCPAIIRSTAQRVDELLNKLRVNAAVVVYRFGAKQDIETLESRNIIVTRAPVDARVLAKSVAGLCTDDGVVTTTPDVLAPVRPPRFSEESLATFALSETAASCGCQRNLVDVVLSLRALEEYLGGCESRSEDDEALHRALRDKVSEARSSIEDAIEHFASTEGINLR